VIWLAQFVNVIIRTIAESWRSSKWSAAAFQISSVTGFGRSASRVAASVSSSAARSLPVKYGVSRQLTRLCSRSSVSPVVRPG